MAMAPSVVTVSEEGVSRIAWDPGERRLS
jgi:hypothetical protein